MRHAYRLPLLLLCLFGAVARAQTPAAPPDTARPASVTLPEATVVGYGQNLPLRRTAAAVGVLDARVVNRFSEASLTQAVNTLPGVRLEERATASYRLSIRGSTLRSPFGVRNVKVYYHDIPFTEASGSTPLNLLDPVTLGRIEVIKGPAGSLYGAGTGGVALLQTRQLATDGSLVRAGASAGSYGLRRYTAEALNTNNSATQRQQTYASFAHQTLSGHRQQSALRRTVLALGGELQTSAKRTVAAHLLYTDLDYQLPGGLTRAQLEQNPRQARPGTPAGPGTVAQRTFYASRTALLGLTHEYRFTPRFTNKTTLYTTGSVIRTPYLVDYERNTQVGGGGRTAFGYRTALADRTLRLAAGGELQTSFENARNYQNRAGTPGPLRYDDEIRTVTGFVFGQADYELPAELLLTVAASYNRLRYRINRVSDATLPAGYQLERNFRPEVSPRVALLREFGDNLAVYGSVSTGFSPPSEEEIRPSDGSLNTGLQAERGTSYELGARGQAFSNGFAPRLDFDVSVFDFRLRNTIVTRTTERGAGLFSNAGATRQRGLEAAAGLWLWQQWASIPEAEQQARNMDLGYRTTGAGLRLWSSYAYYHFRFADYQQADAAGQLRDYSGNQLTGAAPHTLSAGLDLNLPIGLYARPALSHQSRLPLNDANTDYAAGYWTFAARAGWRRTLLRHLEADVYAGVENATNRRYSLGNDLNAFGGRYFQPAPGRNYYGGLSLGWRW
ncbi:TonB-dependent receptor plug domain-containing protein [Hymenobacter busanensis]|uniref:TonB-dependent receptor plug domain-containing protein n=1 Tax=Hymenobacter busanensis TaxID=2607656 RepID=A0A7L4ZUD9_9BACT|nr:TonB-dependent receptor [Hymenobacter busanensis]KAA9339159.1 TonB-dependent receptor plug domain-containing protein [Hymenobacter busanensis]QHJ07079.1 TonB-dependent receptor plug domain-containing protein [Hymenobacter busanensis]